MRQQGCPVDAGRAVRRGGTRQTHGQLPAAPRGHGAQYPARLPPRWRRPVGSPCCPWARAGLCSLLRGGRAAGDPVCGAHSLPCVQSRAGQGAAGGLSCCPRPRAGPGGLSSRGSAVPQAEEEKRRKKEEAARKRQEQEVASASAGGGSRQEGTLTPTLCLSGPSCPPPLSPRPRVAPGRLPWPCHVPHTSLSYRKPPLSAFNSPCLGVVSAFLSLPELGGWRGAPLWSRNSDPTCVFQAAKLAKMKIPPSEMFLAESDKYSKFDENVRGAFFFFSGHC